MCVCARARLCACVCAGNLCLSPGVPIKPRLQRHDYWNVLTELQMSISDQSLMTAVNNLAGLIEVSVLSDLFMRRGQPELLPLCVSG